jgi:hypothetical protein
MKKFNLKSLKAELQQLGASDFEIEAITNNASLYNDLITKYKSGEEHNMYLMYQLNVAVMKQKNDLTKMKSKTAKPDKKNNSPFEKMMKKLA